MAGLTMDLFAEVMTGRDSEIVMRFYCAEWCHKSERWSGEQMTVTIATSYQKEIDSATKIMFFLCNIFSKVFSVSECLLCKWIFPNLYGKQKEYGIKGNICAWS